MRILLISEDPRKLNIGGVPTYTVPLAERLAERDHDVMYLSSAGYMHDYDWSFAPRWRRSRKGRLRSSTLVNASAVGLHAGRAGLDVDNRDSARIVAEARRFAPDVIHIHSVLGIPLASFSLLAQLAPVVYSCHEYFIVCQRGNLLRPDGSNCSSFPTGSDCAACIGRTVSPGRHRARALVNNLPADAGKRMISAVESATGVGLEVEPGTARVDGTGTTASPEAVAAYEKRTTAAVDQLNQACSKVFAVSGSVRDNLIAAGVESSRVEVVHIGSSSAELTPRMPLPALESASEPAFIFFGGFNPGKGSKVLMEALRGMDDPPPVEWMGPTDLDDRHRAIRESAPASINFRGKVDRDGVLEALRRSDVMIAPSVAADTSPQAVLESLAAGRPVIGSDIGGIPDFIEDGRNGLIVEPGSVEQLRAAISRLRDPKLLPTIARGVQPPLSVEDHIIDLERRYSELVAGAGRPQGDEPTGDRGTVDRSR